jgi:putative transposase
MRLIDDQFLATPYDGSRQMARWLRRQGDNVGRHQVRRLMALMGVHAIYQDPRTSQPHSHHRIYPYLLRNLAITRAN